MSRLEKAIGPYESFVCYLLAKLPTSLKEPHFEIDHLCYRVKTYRDYYSKKQELSQLGLLLSETEVLGRPISCFFLDKPIRIHFENRVWIIPMIELPAPKPHRPTAEGLEHIEIATKTKPQNLQINLPELPWKNHALSKTVNPEIALEFAGPANESWQIKFHEQPLDIVIFKETQEQITNFIYEDESLFIVDKPAGFFTQKPEYNGHRQDINKYLTGRLSQHLKHDVFPAHRLDAPTSGLILYAKNKNMATELGRLFRHRKITKKYQAVVRGFTDAEGTIDLELKCPETGLMRPSLTTYKTLKQYEIPIQIGKYPSARCSLVEVSPHTGRWRQIRRHFDQIAHPLIGDIEHGDSHHNRLHRDHLGLSGLFLRATELTFTHPLTAKLIHVQAPPHSKWDRMLATLEPYLVPCQKY